MVKQMFGDQTGNSAPNLQGITFCSDRGYWSPTLLFGILLKCGADVLGTVARTFWFPFSFEKTSHPTNTVDRHGRIVVPMKGSWDIFAKKIRYRHRHLLRALCYRSGTGSAVSTAMTTLHDNNILDLNLRSPSDRNWYFNRTITQRERNDRAFTMIASNGLIGTPTCLDHILEQPIRPLTTSQGDVGWFLLRRFSLTSSTVDRLLLRRTKTVFCDNDVRRDYEKVLTQIDALQHLPTTNMPQSDEDQRAQTEEHRTTTSNRTEHDNPVDGAAKEWINRISSATNTANHAAARTEFCSVVGGLDEQICRSIVRQHPHGDTVAGRSISAVRSSLRSWATDTATPLHCRYWFLSKEQLKTELNTRAISFSASSSKRLLLEKLVEGIQEQGHNGTTTPVQPDPLLIEIFRASFLRPLKQDAKEYCRIGHAMEHPYMKQLILHSKKGLTGQIQAHAVFSSPLVQSNSAQMMAVLDSSDGELVYSEADNTGLNRRAESLRNNSDCQNIEATTINNNDDSNPETHTASINPAQVKVMPVECKARLADTTFLTERDNNERNANLHQSSMPLHERNHDYSDNLPTYYHIPSNDLHQYINNPSERIQLLHHAAIRDAQKALILVGDGRGQVMYGVFVAYNDDTLRAYKSVLKDLYRQCLEWAYNADNELPQSKIQATLSSPELSQLKIQWHSFMTIFKIWKRVRAGIDVSFPLPPCSRILPYTHSLWNVCKGASDTTTKLFWNCQVCLPAPTPGVVAVGRFLQLFDVVLHRMYQLATAGDNIGDLYPSLLHFRTAANRRIPFHRTTTRLSEWFVEEATRKPTVSGEQANNELRTPKRQRKEHDNPRRAFSNTLEMTPTTHGTPTKGRPSIARLSSPEWRADQDRLHNCVGDIHVVSKTDDETGKECDRRGHCTICGAKTKFYCALCRRFYCLDKSRDGALRDMICKGDERVAFLEGKRPPSVIVSARRNKSGELIKHLPLINSCFHAAHYESCR